MELCRKENPFQVIYGTFLAHAQREHLQQLQDYYEGGKRAGNAVVNFYWDSCSYGKEAFVPVPYPQAEDVIQLIH